MISSIKTISDYSRFLCWLIHDSLWRNRGISLLIVISGVLGVSFQVQVFGLIIYYAKHFSSGEMIRFWGYEVDPRNSLSLLAIASVAVFFLLALSALSIYYSRRSLLRLSRKYGVFCAKRVFTMLDSGVDAFGLSDNAPDVDRYMLGLVNADSRVCNRILMMILSLIVPASTLAVSMAALVYLEPFLTLFTIAFLGVFGFVQSLISRKTSVHSLRYDNLGPEAGKDYKALIQYFKHQPENNAGQEMVDRLFKAGPIKRHLDAYEGILSGVENSRLASGVFMALVMGVILLVMGSSIIRDGTGWGRLLVYLVALRFTMTNLQTSFAIITSVNRFYHQVRRYFLFVETFRPKDNIGYPPQDHYDLMVSKNCLPGSQGSLVLRRGSRLALITSQELDRYTIAALAGAILGRLEPVLRSALSSTRFATAKHSWPQISLRKFLGFDGRCAWNDMKTWFADEQLWGIANDQLPNDLDQTVKREIWDGLEPKLRFALSLISTANSDCCWALVEARALGLLERESAKWYLNLFKQKIVILVFNEELAQAGTYGEDAVAVVVDDELLGLGSVEWFRGQRSQVEEILGPELQKLKRREEIEEEADELLTDM